tara:strand:+ start:336 stop:563 length:228 start_codon:yes stop_codon:yes gene_type:complete
MSRPDVLDKDPFANTEDIPRDNVSSSGFLTRFLGKFVIRRIVWFVITVLIISLVTGTQIDLSWKNFEEYWDRLSP